MTSPQADSSAISTENSEAPKPNIIGRFPTIDEFTKEAFTEIVKATKAANAYPQGTSRDLYCSYPSYGRIIDQQSHRILGLISKVLKRENIKGNIQRRQRDEQFEMLLECNDTMLERIGSNLDELAGIKKNPQPIIVESRLNDSLAMPSSMTEIGRGAGSWNAKRNTESSSSPTTSNLLTTARLITAKNIARPQTNFSVPVDNNNITPFVPRLKEKPNSIKPLAILPEYDDSGVIVSYLHPYEFELLKFTVPSNQLKPLAVQLPKDIRQCELVYIDTIDKLRKAIEELRAHKTIAVDVEHHSYRTFLGLTCLVQISSVDKDYIFDALELRESMHELNIIFTDSSVVKIFHGADCDIEWLQRDLSIYVVNMFDTHQAAKSLNFARLSLAYLLKHYCDLDLDKSLQLADWRMRPLPHELLEYARRDTHYLIYAYQRLSNNLLETGNNSSKLLSSVYQRCTEICKKRYQKPTLSTTTHIELCHKTKRIFDNRQLYALEHIVQWRDDIARREDESYGYVLPNHMMLQIAESLPREMQGILACCNPIPPLVRQHLHTIHQIILRAREQPLVKPILETMEYCRDAVTQRKVYNEKLHSILDNTHDEEFRDDLPVLIRFDNDEMVVNKSDITNGNLCSAKISYYEKGSLRKRVQTPDLSKLLMPYQRFLAYIPFAEQEKREEAERIEAMNKAKRLCPAGPEVMNFKQEVVVVTQSEVNDEDENDLYKLPMREMIKRKHEESRAKKAAEKYKNQQNSKRLKTDHRQTTSNTSTNKPQSDKEDNDESDAPVELPISKEEAPPNENVKSKSKKRKNNKNNRFNNKRKKTKQSSDNTVDDLNSPAATTSHQQREPKRNFDYENVNFKKFSGGAQRFQGTELLEKHHGKKANKATNKKMNKLFTFSNKKGNK